MKRQGLSADKVVDLLRYRRERTQGRLNFDNAQERRPALALVTPFRPLSARELSHRERMMRHLTSSR